MISFVFSDTKILSGLPKAEILNAIITDEKKKNTGFLLAFVCFVFIKQFSLLFTISCIYERLARHAIVQLIASD